MHNTYANSIFCNRKFEHNMTFTYNGQDLDIEDGFVYLGAFFFL